MSRKIHVLKSIKKVFCYQYTSVYYQWGSTLNNSLLQIPASTQCKVQSKCKFTFFTSQVSFQPLVIGNNPQVKETYKQLSGMVPTERLT